MTAPGSFGSEEFCRIPRCCFSRVSGPEFASGRCKRDAGSHGRDPSVSVYESIRLPKTNSVDTVWHQRPNACLSAAEKGLSNTVRQGGRIPVDVCGCRWGRLTCTARSGIRRAICSRPGDGAHTLMEISAQQQHSSPSDTEHSGTAGEQRLGASAPGIRLLCRPQRR